MLYHLLALKINLKLFLFRLQCTQCFRGRWVILRPIWMYTCFKTISSCAHAAAQTTSPILCRRATVIRHGLVSARRPAAAILFHGQELNLETEPSLWPAQLYGTVYQQQFVKLSAWDRAFSVAGPVIWNSLPAAVRETDSLHSFRRKLKTHLFTLCFNDWWL